MSAKEPTDPHGEVPRHFRPLLSHRTGHARKNEDYSPTRARTQSLEYYTISAVNKSPKIWYNKEQEPRKEGKEDGTI